MTALKLLAIDDNRDSAELVARVARKCGYEAQAASDGAALPDMLQKWQPNIISLDLCMPEDDGIAVVSALAESGFCGSLIIISGQDEWFRKSASRLAVARGLRVSADMSKPVHVKELREMLLALAEDTDAPQAPGGESNPG